jgi:hypothetical protein
MSRLLFFVAVLCAGCTEGAGPGPAFAAPGDPHAGRRAGAWQQFCEQASNVPQASVLVAARGADGFELVAMYNGVLCYKRPAPEGAHPVGPSGPAAAPAGAGGSLVPVVRDPGF